jgi:hypothetical protein
MSEPAQLAGMLACGGRHWSWEPAYGAVTLLAAIAVLAWPGETLPVAASETARHRDMTARTCSSHRAISSGNGAVLAKIVDQRGGRSMVPTSFAKSPSARPTRRALEL